MQVDERRPGGSAARERLRARSPSAAAPRGRGRRARARRRSPSGRGAASTTARGSRSRRRDRQPAAAARTPLPSRGRRRACSPGVAAAGWATYRRQRWRGLRGAIGRCPRLLVCRKDGGPRRTALDRRAVPAAARAASWSFWPAPRSVVAGLVLASDATSSPRSSSACSSSTSSIRSSSGSPGWRSPAAGSRGRSHPARLRRRGPRRRRAVSSAHRSARRAGPRVHRTRPATTTC